MSQDRDRSRDIRPLLDRKSREKRPKLESLSQVVATDNKPVVQELYDQLFERLDQLITEDKQELDTSFIPKVIKARDRKMLKLVNDYGNLKNKINTVEELYSTPSHGLQEIKIALRNFCETNDREMELPICSNCLSLSNGIQYTATVADKPQKKANVLEDQGAESELSSLHW